MENNSTKEKTTETIETKEVKNDSSRYSDRQWPRRAGLIGISIIALLLIIFFFATVFGGVGRFRREMTVKRGAPIGVVSRQPGFNRAGRGMRGQFANATLGSLTKINGNTLTIHSNDQDVTITFSSSTSFYKKGQVAKQSDLTVGNILTVVGTPDSNGVIAATRINIR